MYNLLDVCHEVSGVAADVWVKQVYIAGHLGFGHDFVPDFDGFMQVFSLVGDKNPVSHV